MPNQFNNQLAYFQGLLSESYEHEIQSIGDWEAIEPVFTDQSAFQYNTLLDRGVIQLSLAGVWRVDVSATFQGSVNDNMEFCCNTQETGNLPPVKWNARGGNNWAISYATIFQIFNSDNALTFYIRNTSATDTINIPVGTFSAIKLY